MPRGQRRFVKSIALFLVIWASISSISQLVSQENWILTKLSPIEPVDLRQTLGKDAWRYIPRGLSDEQTRTLLVRLHRASKIRKYIYIAHYSIPTLRGKESVCGNCEFTQDLAMIHHPDTKAVVIGHSFFNWSWLQTLNRRKDQLFVWYTGESPESFLSVQNKTLELETKFNFNVTQTYRRDSGIYHPYGQIAKILQTKLDQGIDKNISAILKNKARLAVAAISNCGLTSGAVARIEIINKLQALGLEIDAFGQCFNNTLEQKDVEFRKFLAKYKFYLAFENAFHCRDYITEKFLGNGHIAGVVPVALGATKSEYEALAPKGSFIFAEDFSSLSSLVKYLNYLDQHDEEYLKYFRWIEGGRSSVPEPKVMGFCRLCRMVHGINVDEMQTPGYSNGNSTIPIFTDDVARRTVADLKNWFYETENQDCFSKNVESIEKLIDGLYR